MRDFGVALRRHHALAGKQRDGIARQHPDKRKRDDGHPDERRNEDGDTP
jgi:hypothetical protein